MKDHQKLLNWLNSVAYKDYPKTKAKIINDCQITRFVFEHWRQGRTAIPPLAKPVIEKIAGKKIFN